MASVTIRDIYRLAMPLGTSVVAGQGGMQHQVLWVAMQRATPPAFMNLRGGELALVSIEAMQAMDDQLTMAVLLERLARVPIAAVAVIGPVPENARAIADQVGIPLLHLPDDANLRDVERETQRLINDYEAQLERRGAQLLSTLTQAALAGASLQGLLELLAERTGQALGCYNPIGEVRALRGRGSARVALQTLRPSAPGGSTHLGQSIWVQPLGASGDRLGFLAIAGTALDDWDKLAVQQGAGSLALELAKEHAVQAAEERLRGDLVQAVLMGPTTDHEALVRRGQELGYDLRVPHAALLCAVPNLPLMSSDEHPANKVANLLSVSLNAMGIAAPTMRREDGALAYLPLDNHASRARELAEQLRTRIVGEMPQALLSLGKEAQTISTWSRSLREAEQAMQIGRQLLDHTRVLDFGDLGVYRLLLLLRESPELWEFYRATLATLADYDRKQRAELLKTLEAFFNCLGNLAHTADMLHVHRNTLLYRLKRITEISGMDLDDPEERLALWLALKAHRVLQTIEEEGDI